jgi:hypothetical protein
VRVDFVTANFLERRKDEVRRIPLPRTPVNKASSEPVCAPSIARISSSSFSCTAAPSLFCVFWMRNAIRNVMMVVPVFMTNCQVLLNPNSGPLVAQTRRISTAAAKLAGCPAVREARLAKLSNRVS